MGSLKRFFARLAESDQDRLAGEIREWAESVPGTVRIASCDLRTHLKVAGVVKRITVIPAEGEESLQAVISDGTGEVRAVWMGRRSIPGLDLGTRVVLEGVVAKDRGERQIVNPRFEFSA